MTLTIPYWYEAVCHASDHAYATMAGEPRTRESLTRAHQLAVETLHTYFPVEIPDSAIAAIDGRLALLVWIQP